MKPNFIQKVIMALKSPIKGVLLDITGVLYESGQKRAIEGSVNAIQKLQKMNIPFRFVTNETQNTRTVLVTKLRSFGFILNESEVFSPGPAVCKYLMDNNLRPYLLIHPDLLPEFEPCLKSDLNCVVVGDASEHFTYENMNKAFQLLMSLQNPVLISMGKGKYYKEKDGLVLDLGGYTAGLEFACGIKAKIIGKPFPEFFLSALNDMGVKPEEAVMVGDDLHSDVGAAQKCGMQGVLVRTGKYRASDENNEDVKPDVICSNLAEFVDLLDRINEK